MLGRGFPALNKVIGNFSLESEGRSKEVEGAKICVGKAFVEWTSGLEGERQKDLGPESGAWSSMWSQPLCPIALCSVRNDPQKNPRKELWSWVMTFYFEICNRKEKLDDGVRWRSLGREGWRLAGPSSWRRFKRGPAWAEVERRKQQVHSWHRRDSGRLDFWNIGR